MTSRESPSTLYKAAALAALIELGALVMLGGSVPRHLHLPIQDLPVEAELIPMEAERPRLVAPDIKKALPPEPALSKNLSTKKTTFDSSKTLDSPAHNQIEKGKPISPTHGPILVDSPTPVLPAYLKEQSLDTKVVIEFAVAPNGQSTPRLLSSSGNEELDQIALTAAAKWKFYPAESNHEAIASKVKLRILFEVK